MSDVMRISKRSPVAAKRKRGRSQFAGKSAPGVEPLESCGSMTHGAAPLNFDGSSGPNRAAALAGAPVSRMGCAGKSLHADVHDGVGVVPMFDVPGMKPP